MCPAAGTTNREGKKEGRDDVIKRDRNEKKRGADGSKGDKEIERWREVKGEKGKAKRRERKAGHRGGRQR